MASPEFYDLEAELSVLSGLVHSRSAQAVGFDILRPENFWRPQHATIFEALADLWRDGAQIDTNSLRTFLERSGMIADVAEEDIEAATGTIIIGSVCESAIERVIGLWQKRKLRGMFEVGLANIHEHAPADLLDEMMTQAAELGGRAGAADQSTEMTIDEIYNEITHAEKTGAYEVKKIGTGFPMLDGKLGGGFDETDLVLLAARPGVGKTTMALNMIRRMIASGANIPIAFFSMEMTRRRLLEILLSSVSRVPCRLIQGRTFIPEFSLSADDGARNKVCDALKRIREYPIQIEEAAGITPRKLRTRIKYMIQRMGLRIVFVDYLQLMSPDGKTNSQNEEVGSISKALKQTALECHVPIVAVCQLNRQPEGRMNPEPVLSDLRSSGNLEQDADVVLMGYANRELGEGTEPVFFKLAKNRNGPITFGDNNLTFSFDRPRFRIDQIDVSNGGYDSSKFTSVL